MQAIKQTYVDVMQYLGDYLSPAHSGKGKPYSLKRWFASLFAIYETDRMIALDLPWWNVASTREIESYLSARPGARVFEYGSGASTVWLARRAGHVTSVEHDQAWLAKFQRQTAEFANVSLLYRSIDDGHEAYSGAINEFDGEFDVIVVDGRHRAACLERSVSRLAKGGIVIFDDSGRARYRAAIESCALDERHHFGLSYCVPYPDHTSILSNAAR